MILSVGGGTVGLWGGVQNIVVGCDLEMGMMSSEDLMVVVGGNGVELRYTRSGELIVAVEGDEVELWEGVQNVAVGQAGGDGGVDV